MNLSLDVASIDDVQALSALARQTFIETFGYLYTAENLYQHLDKTCSTDFFMSSLKQDHIITARDGDLIIGYAKFGGLGLPVNNPQRDATEIHRLYVTQPYQARGVGAALMEEVMRHDRIQSSPAIYLGVWENNIKAQRFYSRYGFSAVGEYMYPVGTQLDREIIMMHCPAKL
jgi:ribosomal protein S18 acetylase RimI-like enzyme